MKRRVCKKCKIITDQNVCPICKGDNFATTFKGRVYVLDTAKSEVGKKVNAPIKGEYALKV
jgi:DNA-directed RNA polymerase subunit E"